MSDQSSGSPTNRRKKNSTRRPRNAEGGLYSEAGVIKEQARQVQPLNDGENLLKVASDNAPTGDKAMNRSCNGKEPSP